VNTRTASWPQNENGGNMNGKNMQNNVFEEQLYEAQSALFAAQSIRQVKFLQMKINYLKQRMKESKK
jgi:hypothetical protein